MKNNILPLILILSLVLGSCKKDNREPPSSTITGKVMYNKVPLGLRSGGVELELWQYGYQLRNKIPVYLNQDGSFSVKVFDGDYKMTMVRDNGPWAGKTDSIDVKVNGTATIEVNVDPYFIISNATFQKSGTSITATVNVQRVNTSRTLEAVRFYIGLTNITDANNNAANASKAGSTITDITQPITLTATIPASAATKEFVFVRAGVKTTGVAELIYSAPVQFSLK
jgi:hypothetical protein